MATRKTNNPYLSGPQGFARFPDPETGQWKPRKPGDNARTPGAGINSASTATGKTNRILLDDTPGLSARPTAPKPNRIKLSDTVGNAIAKDVQKDEFGLTEAEKDAAFNAESGRIAKALDPYYKSAELDAIAKGVYHGDGGYAGTIQVQDKHRQDLIDAENSLILQNAQLASQDRQATRQQGITLGESQADRKLQSDQIYDVTGTRTVAGAGAAADRTNAARRVVLDEGNLLGELDGKKTLAAKTAADAQSNDARRITLDEEALYGGVDGRQTLAARAQVENEKQGTFTRNIQGRQMSLQEAVASNDIAVSQQAQALQEKVQLGELTLAQANQQLNDFVQRQNVEISQNRIRLDEGNLLGELDGKQTLAAKDAAADRANEARRIELEESQVFDIGGNKTVAGANAATNRTVALGGLALSGQELQLKRDELAISMDQFDRNLAEQIRRGDMDNLIATGQLNNQTVQTLAEYGVGGLQSQKLALDTRQVEGNLQLQGAELDLKREELAKSADQFDRSLAEQIRSKAMDNAIAVGQLNNQTLQTVSQYGIGGLESQRLALDTRQVNLAESAQSADVNLRTRAQNLQEEVQRGQLTLAQAEQTLNDEIQRGQLDISKRQITLAEGAQSTDTDIRNRTLELQAEIQRGSLSVDQANQKLNDFVQRQNVDIAQNRVRLDEEALYGGADGRQTLEAQNASADQALQTRRVVLDEKLGQGGLDLQREELAQRADQFDQTLAEEIRQGLRDYEIQGGQLNNQTIQTLAEYGVGGLQSRRIVLDERAQDLAEEIQRGQLGLARDETTRQLDLEQQKVDLSRVGLDLQKEIQRGQLALQTESERFGQKISEADVTGFYEKYGQQDWSVFQSAFNKRANEPGYQGKFDFNSDGVINFPDFIEFSSRLGQGVQTLQKQQLDTQKATVAKQLQLDERKIDEASNQFKTQFEQAQNEYVWNYDRNNFESDRDFQEAQRQFNERMDMTAKQFAEQMGFDWGKLKQEEKLGFAQLVAGLVATAGQVYVGSKNNDQQNNTPNLTTVGLYSPSGSFGGQQTMFG